MPTKAIYTCIVGGYDDVLQPEVVDPSFDYLLFVPSGSRLPSSIGVWQVREFGYLGPDATTTSRYPKMNPHLLLSQYDYTLWMDGNLSIVDRAFYDAVNVCIARGDIYAGVRHVLRDCVYDDAVSCVHAMRDDFCHIFRTVRFLLSEGFPRHYGLFENNIILRRQDPKVSAFNAMWWQLFLDYPRRDQFVAPYCLRALSLQPTLLLPEGQSAKTSAWLRYEAHLEGPKSFWRHWYDYFACRVRTYFLIFYLRLRQR